MAYSMVSMVDRTHAPIPRRSGTTAHRHLPVDAAPPRLSQRIHHHRPWHLRKPNCRCHQSNQPGQGPNVRLTHKVEGKTITETFATPAELHKAQRDVEVYHHFRELAAQLLAVNEQICSARPVEQELTPQKETADQSARKSHAK